MEGTRKARVPMSEQIRLINECRQSGMTDADWCRENDIAVSTFYNWVSRCRKAAADQIPAANYGHLEVPRPKQDVVPIDIVPDHIPEQHTASRMLNSHLDNCKQPLSEDSRAAFPGQSRPYQADSLGYQQGRGYSAPLISIDRCSRRKLCFLNKYSKSCR